MTKLLPLLFAIILFTQQGKTQCFATAGSKWVYTATHQVTDHSGTIVYTYERDSIIDNLPVKVLSNQYVMYLHMWDNNGYFLTGDNVLNPNPGFDYLYSDSNVVKYYKDGEFYTLADFTMQPGDSFKIAYNSPYNRDLSYTTYTHVDSVGTVNINGEDLRYLVYSTPEHDGVNVRFDGKFVEKIGFYNTVEWQFMFPSLFSYEVSDLAGWGEPYIEEELGGFRCFSDNSPFIYNSNYTEGDCIFLVGTVEHEFEKIKLFPNPVSDEVTISSPVNIIGVQVVNVLGQVSLTSHSINPTAYKIDLTLLPTGIYSVNLKLENSKIYTKRIVKE